MSKLELWAKSHKKTVAATSTAFVVATLAAIYTAKTHSEKQGEVQEFGPVDLYQDFENEFDRGYAFKQI